MTGIELITVERERQVSVEDWTPEHDAEHAGGEMIKAAVAYADCNLIMMRRHESFVVKDVRADLTIYQDPWPWGSEWDKRRKHDSIKRLTISGALIAAEIDRLQRLAAYEAAEKEKP